MTRCVFLLLVAIGLATGGASAEEAPRRPNIIVFLADDLGYGELGCQGNPRVPTPNIDSIAEAGVRFTDGYVTAPYCSASRAGILTGRYQNRFGYEFNPIGWRNDDPDVGLPSSEKTLAELLHDAGYTTALVGKWHLGGAAEYHPLRNGFDEFFGFLHEGHFFVPPPYRGVTTMLRRKTLPNGGQGRYVDAEDRLVYSTHMGHDEPAYDANNPILRGGQPVDEHTYLTDAFTREAADFIRRTSDRPFFLLLAYNAVHSPLQASDAYMERFAHIDDVHRRIFAGMLSNMDDSVGEVLAQLREEGLEDDTLIFFLSDNGGPTRELTSSNAPLRGEKGQTYEGGLRVPFLMQWKGVVPAGETYSRPVVSLDIYATAAAAAGALLPKNVKIDGVDLLPYVSGANDGRPHETLYWRLRQRNALRHGDWKIVRNPAGRPDNQWRLYNLKTDIGETNDLADEHSDQLQELLGLWETFNGQMQEPFWSP